MPGISIENRRYPSVSTEIFGKRTAQGSEVTLVITREGCVQMGEHDLLVEYARECLLDRSMHLRQYADQVLAPHPLEEGRYVPVNLAFDHSGNTSQVVLFASSGGRLYEWDI